jgi:hypothetical protein
MMENPEQTANPRPFVGPEANGNTPHGEQAPPVHEPEQPAPQPMQAMVELLEDARVDIGGLISRTDQLEATVRRVDRQILMTIGVLAIVLYGVKQLAGKLEELDVGGA